MDVNGGAGPGGVGRVVGTEDATPLGYWFALGPGCTVQLDDVVMTDRTLPDGSTLSLSGVVTQVRARHEGARFDSDVFLIEDGVLPAQVSESAQVATTRAEPEVFVPPLPGGLVRLAEGKERGMAGTGDRRQETAGRREPEIRQDGSQ